MLMTKIIATIGPASDSIETIKEIILSGANALRLNFSHGDHEWHKKTAKLIRDASESLNRPISLIADTKGPEIRIGKFIDNKVFIKENDYFVLTNEEILGDKNKVSISYKDLAKDINIDSRIFIDDGLLELKVSKIIEKDIVCIAMNSAELGNNKGVNVPDVYINMPVMTDKDKDDIKFAIENNFDFIAISFVRSEKDVSETRNYLKENDAEDIKLISKIENQYAVNNIIEIVENSDAIMIARGDLGIETSPEEVPLVQKSIIEIANKSGKPTIVATQMLESMSLKPRPTRAETSDVANAIFDGADAVMLSGETASGLYPVKSVSMMARIIQKIESSVNYRSKIHEFYKNFNNNITNSISYAACFIASDINISSIVAVTKSGATSQLISKFRPKCPILAITPNKIIYRQLSLVWGCFPIYCERINIDDLNFNIAIYKALETNIVKHGDIIIIIAGLPLGVAGTSNTLKVHVVS
ncbi:MAG: pyruvate kinase [Clostridiales bacterium]|jgi:pyruvate kinase|nr:pyruvate kinase [Clostridiales bacterium]